MPRGKQPVEHNAEDIRAYKKQLLNHMDEFATHLEAVQFVSKRPTGPGEHAPGYAYFKRFKDFVSVAVLPQDLDEEEAPVYLRFIQKISQTGGLKQDDVAAWISEIKQQHPKLAK